MIPHWQGDGNIKLGNVACLDPKCAALPAFPTQSHTAGLICTLLAPGAPSAKFSLLFPLPGITAAHLDGFLAHLLLPWRSFPDHSDGAELPALFIYCALNLFVTAAVTDVALVLSLCDYFFDFCLLLLDVWVQNYVLFLLTIETLELWKIMRCFKN